MARPRPVAAGALARRPPTGAAPAGPVTAPGEVRFRLADPAADVAAATLYQDLRRPRLGPPLARGADGVLEAALPVPAGLLRLEYAFSVERRDGATEWMCDPANPLRTAGPFGEKSVVELPGYAAPAWTLTPAEPGESREVALAVPALGAELTATVWTPPGSGWEEPLPLLVVHDGPEYARYAGLLDFLSTAVAGGRVPPVRAALVPPHRRDDDYSAAALYARALAREILPGLLAQAPAPAAPGAVIGMGASLGALAMLHAHRRHPDAFGALFLQSGSFFRPRLDGQEAGYGRFARIVRFTGSLARGVGWASPIPVTMTCGASEENAANNRLVRDALRRRGYPVRLAETGDLHTWTGWRDALDPHLTALLAEVAG